MLEDGETRKTKDQGIASPEVKHQTNFVKLKFTDPQLAETTEAYIAESLIHGLNRIKYWSARLSDIPLSADTSTKEQIASRLHQARAIMKHLDNNVRDLQPCLAKDGSITFLPMDIIETPENMKAAQEKALASGWISPNYIEISISSMDELQGIIGSKIHDVTHDVRNVLTATIGFLQLVQRDKAPNPHFIDRINQSIEQLDESVEQQVATIAETFEFPKQFLSIRQIKQAFERYAIPVLTSQEYSLQNCSLEIGEYVPEEVKVEWSRQWAGGLFTNLAQNAARAYEALKLTDHEAADPWVRVRIGVSPDNQNLEIAFENNGTRCPPGIIEQGFIRASDLKVHGYGGSERVRKLIRSTGSAMRRYAAIMKDYYKGGLRAENITEAQGQIIGTRIVVSVPLTPESQRLIQNRELVFA